MNNDNSAVQVCKATCFPNSMAFNNKQQRPTSSILLTQSILDVKKIVTGEDEKKKLSKALETIESCIIKENTPLATYEECLIQLINILDAKPSKVWIFVKPQILQCVFSF